jgi:hypothetical protein
MTCTNCSKLLAECDEAARRIASMERREARLREALLDCTVFVRQAVELGLLNKSECRALLKTWGAALQP